MEEAFVGTTEEQVQQVDQFVLDVMVQQAEVGDQGLLESVEFDLSIFLEIHYLTLHPTKLKQWPSNTNYSPFCISTLQ